MIHPIIISSFYTGFAMGLGFWLAGGILAYFFGKGLIGSLKNARR